MSKPINMRRCIVCRNVKHKSELLRVVKTADNFSLDLTGKQDGRGAYVCKSPDCVASLVKRRNLDKVFKIKLPDKLYDMIKEQVHM